MQTIKKKLYIFIFLIFLLLGACQQTKNSKGTVDMENEDFWSGGVYHMYVSAKVIEIVSRHSLIIEIVYLHGEIPDRLKERKENNMLIPGDIVNAVFRDDDKQSAEYIYCLSEGDLIAIAFEAKRKYPFDFSVIPTVVDCDGLLIINEDGTANKEFHGSGY